MSRPTDETPLGDAKAWLRERLDGGEQCPCCKQRAQMYKRKLNVTMVQALAYLARAQRATPEAEFVHAPTVLAEHAGLAREVGKLALWDLVIEGTAKRGDGGHAGMWRVSVDGMAFLAGAKRVRKYAKVYNGERFGFDGDMVNITEVAGEFDLRELLEGI